MMKTYPVTLDGNTVGSVTSEETGLYYRFRCQCKLPKKQRVSLFANGENLGILIPNNEFFCLTTKVPQKRFEGENITFRLVKREGRDNSILIPVRSGGAFPEIARLQEAVFVITSEGPMIKLSIK